MTKKIIIPIAAVTILGAGLVSSSKIFAQTTNTTSPMSTLVQKIADKFGLKVADVQSVFDQDRSDRQTQMEAKYEEQLSQYVKDGKITDAQKQLILARHKEIESTRQSQRQSMENMTDDQRKAAMEANRTKMQEERTALQSWATQKGIDIKYVMGFGMRGGHGGKWMQDSNSTSSTVAK